MFEYIKGKITDLNPTTVVIETTQIGYSINISLNTYTFLEGKEDATLYIYEAIREDAFTLYGFSTKEERSLFLLLISVSGIGSNTARMILSSFSVAELQSIILSEDVSQLKGVKGIGLKTAQRVIIDLKDKVNKEVQVTDSTPFSKKSDDKEEAINAMVLLGFNRSAASKVIDKILSDLPNLTLEKIIKEALKRI